MKSWTLAAAIVLFAATAFAVAPGTDVYIPSVAHAPGSCVNSICSVWRTDVWIYNPSSTSVTVTVAFLARNSANTSPTTETVTVAAGETKEIDDIVYTLFNLDPGAGALRFTAPTQIVVTGRIYDANVVTNKGTGSAGQFFGGMPAQLAIGLGESTNILGLAQEDLTGSTGDHRANFGFVETTGNGATVLVTKVDSSGATLASKSYTLGAYEPRQYGITDVGGSLGTNQRLLATVTSGTGKVLAFGSQVDNRTGDPYTVDMVTPLGTGGGTTGTFDGVVWTADSQYVDGGIELAVDGTGLLGYDGVAGIPCGSSLSYVVDFYDSPMQAIAIGSNGSFSTQVTHTYSDTTGDLFSTTWTLSGTVGSNGVISGTLRSDTSGGSGDNIACNAIIDRPWKAGWTGN